MAYAIANKLGFSNGEVKWVTEPFDSSYAPGPKSFDFDINEISITKPRAKAVDFSAPYYTNPQGIIVSADSKYAHATSLAALQERQDRRADRHDQPRCGRPALIKPTTQPDVFNTSNDVVAAFKIHRVDAIVVDLATAFELTSASSRTATIAGQFTAPGGDNWGVLLTKGSRLTPCVEPGGQRAAGRRHAGGAQQALDRVGGQRARAALSRSATGWTAE